MTIPFLNFTAASEKGVSSPFFRQQGQTITQPIYLQNCIKARLLPFVNRHHAPHKVLFWPDLASSHYGGEVRTCLAENGLTIVPRHSNPQACSQARPIETLWSILEQLVYSNGWEAKTLSQLESRIRRKTKEIDPNIIQAMFSGIPKQLRKIATGGPYKACKC